MAYVDYSTKGMTYVPLRQIIDDFLIKSSKLENQLRTTSLAFSAFLESFEQIAYKACNTKGNIS